MRVDDLLSLEFNVLLLLLYLFIFFCLLLDFIVMLTDSLGLYKIRMNWINYSKRSILTLKNPTEHGTITNWNDIHSKRSSIILLNKLCVDPEKLPNVCIKPTGHAALMFLFCLQISHIFHRHIVCKNSWNNIQQHYEMW